MRIFVKPALVFSLRPWAGALASSVALWGAGAHAETPADFYKGKTVSIIVGGIAW